MVPSIKKKHVDGVKIKAAAKNPSISEEAVERLRQNFARSPRKSTRAVACELGMPQKKRHCNKDSNVMWWSPPQGPFPVREPVTP
ncbi:hypothetical protein TNCV_3022371 [Trichonephila clavipes]|nr:hypothetical protein TNCV_3022371 [Trichonephila clavipes]